MINWISFLCFGVFVVLLFSMFKKGTDVFSPARLFSLVWSFAIGLTDLKLSRYQIQWSFFSWIMLLISLFSVLTGMFVVYVINFEKPLNKIGSIRYSIINSKINSAVLLRYTMFLFLGYLISYIVSYLVIGFLPFFTKYPGLARNDWGIFGFGLFIQAFPAIVYFVILYYVLVKENVKKKLVLATILLATFITYAFLLQRYYLVFAILLSAVSLYYSSNLLRLKNVLILFAVIVSIVYSMTFIRLSGTIVNYLYYLSDMRYSVKYAFFTEPYMYVVMNLENFANAVMNLENFSYGTFSFDFIFALTGVKHNLIEYMHLSDFPNLLTNNYNTYTMFFIYYRDFGVLGLGIVPFLLGILFSGSYYKMRTNPSINTVSVYAVVVFVIIFSFFVPIISFLHFVFNFLVIFVVTKKIEMTFQDIK